MAVVGGVSVGRREWTFAILVISYSYNFKIK